MIAPTAQQHPLLRPLVTKRQRPPHRRERLGILRRIGEFLSYIEPSVTASSFVVVQQSLRSLVKGMVGKEVSSENLRAWLRHRLSVDRIAPATLRLERTYANRFFKWCVDMGYLERNPLTPIPTVPVPLVIKPDVDEATYAKLQDAFAGTPLLPLVIVGWFTGARLSDIVNLTPSKIDLARRVLRFVPLKTTKSGRVVELPFNEELAKLFALHIELTPGPTDPLFPEALMLWKRRDGSVQRLFKYYAGKAGIAGITFHALRHTRASRMLNGDNAVSLVVAADVLGLSNLNTLRRYTHTSLADKAKGMEN